MTEERKDSEWLERTLVGLLTDASSQTPTDHQACAKYADLLWKMLPRTAQADPRSLELDRLRKRLINREPGDGQDGA